MRNSEIPARRILPPLNLGDIPASRPFIWKGLVLVKLTDNRPAQPRAEEPLNQPHCWVGSKAGYVAAQPLWLPVDTEWIPRANRRRIVMAARVYRRELPERVPLAPLLRVRELVTPFEKQFADPTSDSWPVTRDQDALLLTVQAVHVDLDGGLVVVKVNWRDLPLAYRPSDAPAHKSLQAKDGRAGGLTTPEFQLRVSRTSTGGIRLTCPQLDPTFTDELTAGLSGYVYHWFDSFLLARSGGGASMLGS